MKIRPTFLLALAALVLSLTGLAYLGSFTRLHADDFCIAGDAAHLGFFPSIQSWYTHWTGRFMYLVFAHLVSYGGPALAAVSPALLIFAWLLALSWAFYPLVRRCAWDEPRLLAAGAAGLALLVLFLTTPNLFQSVFWRDGQVNYSFPLLGLTLLGGFFLRYVLSDAAPGWAALAAAFGLAWASGGFSETFDAMQAAIWVLMLAAILLLAAPANRRRLLPLAGVALLGSLVALVIVVIAPGNQVRQDLLPYRVGLFRIITFSIRNAAYIVAKYAIWHPGWALLSIAVPFLTAWWLTPASIGPRPERSLRKLWRESWFRGLVLLPAAAFILVAAACAPVVYAMDAYPDDRTIMIPQFILVLAAITWSGLLGWVLRRLRFLADPAQGSLRRALPALLLGALILAAGITLFNTVRSAPEYQAYAQSWDTRAAQLNAAHLNGPADIKVPGLAARFGIADLQAGPDYWVNRCMASYYGLANIVGY